jgi:hypothetical protein
MAAFSHFPAPATETVPILDNGDSIKIRKRLTVGEERRARRRMYFIEPGTGLLRYDPTMGGMTTVLAYLLDWTLERGGEKVEILHLAIEGEKDDTKIAELQAILEKLDPTTFDAIEAAIKAHEAAEDAARAAAKKSTGGGPLNGSTSSSPSGPAGASSMSEASTAMTTTT